MTTLTDFLLARIADDQATALLAVVDLDDEPTAGVIDAGSNVWPSHLRFAQQHTPARVLAECEAKRRIVDALILSSDPFNGQRAQEPLINSAALAHLAEPYADHPDYDPAWRFTPAHVDPKTSEHYSLLDWITSTPKALIPTGTRPSSYPGQ